SGDPALVREAVHSLEPADRALVLRAFGLYFQLANTAEQHHRVRRRREDAPEHPPRRESPDAAVEGPPGVSDDELRRRLADVSLELVLTAHPTEATRRTFLVAHTRIAALLRRLDESAPGTEGREEVEAALGEEIALLWETDEVRPDRPRV